MFLLHPAIFVWDLVILMMISLGICGALICALLIKQYRTHQFAVVCLRCICTICMLCSGIIAYGSFIEPQIITVTKESIQIDGSASLHIAVLGDMHVGPYKDKKFMQRVVKRTNQLLPDLVLLPGDYIFDPSTDIADLAPLQDLQASLGTFAVLGNHDMGWYRTPFGQRYEQEDRIDDIQDALEEYGITVLHNENRIISLGEESIAIAGIDDLWTGHADLEKAFQGIRENTFTILLSHNPSVITDTESHQADLIISGHTHGGQIRLPFIGPVPDLPTTLGKKFDQGVFPLETGNTLAITRGLGESAARARLLAWPEILLLEI